MIKLKTETFHVYLDSIHPALKFQIYVNLYYCYMLKPLEIVIQGTGVADAINLYTFTQGTELRDL